MLATIRCRILSSNFQSKNIKIEIYRTIVLPAVLFRREIWSLTLREEHRLRVFENRVLRRMLRVDSDKVRGEWRKIHKEICDLYFSSSSFLLFPIPCCPFGRRFVSARSKGFPVLRQPSRLLQVPFFLSVSFRLCSSHSLLGLPLSRFP